MIFSFDNKVYNFSYKRLNDLFEYSSAAGEPNYAKAYAVWISPKDYLSLTCPDVPRFIDRAEPLDYKRLCSERQEMFLRVDFDTGEVVGHEGRHRMAALYKAGVNMVAISVYARGDKGKYNRQFIEQFTVTGQKFDYVDPPCQALGVVKLKCLVPISLLEKALVYKVFGPDSALGTFMDKRLYAVEDICQFSSGKTVSERERYIGTVKGFSDNPDYSKGIPHSSAPYKISYVHIHNETNPKGYQDYSLKIEDFLNWIQEGKYKVPTKDLSSLENLMDAAKNNLCCDNKAEKGFEREL